MKSSFAIAFLLLMARAFGQSLPTASDTAAINALNREALAAYLSNPEKTDRLSATARRWADSVGYSLGLADSYYGLSLIAKLKADDGDELNYHMQALPLYQSLNELDRVARTLTAIGVVYANKGDLESAAGFYIRGLTTYKKVGDRSGEAATYRKMGNLELDRRQFDKAREAYVNSLNVERRLGDDEGIANSLNNIGVAYYEEGRFADALPYYMQALEIIRKINNLNRLPAAYHNIARVYFAQGNYDKALELGLLDLPLARSQKIRPAIIEATLLLSEVYAKKGDHKKSLEYLQLHNRIKDSIYREDNAAQFARLNAVYKTEEKERELKLLTKEHELVQFRQTMLFVALVVLTVAGAIVIYLLRKQIRAKQEIIRKNAALHEAQLGLTKAELENKQLAEKQLQDDLEFRHKELLTYTLNLVQKNTVMQHLRDGIHELLGSTDSDSKLKMGKLIKAIDYSLESEKDWDEFRMYFEKVHTSFFDNLKTHFPDLTQSDLKLCALISLNLSMKEIAELLGISTESVKMARHRLRKKLELATEENLGEFIVSFKKA